MTYGSNSPLCFCFIFLEILEKLLVRVFVTITLIQPPMSISSILFSMFLSPTGVCEPWDSPTCQAMNASLDCSADKVSTDCEQIDEPGYITSLHYFLNFHSLKINNLTFTFVYFFIFEYRCAEV